MTPSVLLDAPAFRSRQDPQHPGFPTTFPLRRVEIVPYAANERPVFWRLPPKKAVSRQQAHQAPAELAAAPLHPCRPPGGKPRQT